MRLRSALVVRQRCVFFMIMAMLAMPAATSSQAGAQSKRKKKKRRVNVSRCVKYSQAPTKIGVNVELDNRCGIELTCGVTWTVRCAATPKHPHHAGDSFSLDEAGRHVSEATSDVCGDDGWEIGNIRWSCKAAK